MNSYFLSLLQVDLERKKNKCSIFWYEERRKIARKIGYWEK
jgi:hypothetical protein